MYDEYIRNSGEFSGPFPPATKSTMNGRRKFESDGEGRIRRAFCVHAFNAYSFQRIERDLQHRLGTNVASAARIPLLVPIALSPVAIPTVRTPAERPVAPIPYGILGRSIYLLPFHILLSTFS